MSSILFTLLFHSLEACAVGLLILLVKRIAGTRLSPRFHSGIWLVFVCKLALPFRIPLIPHSTLPAAMPSAVPAIPVPEPAAAAGTFAETGAQAAATAAAAHTIPWAELLFAIYLTGITALLAALGFSWLRTVRQLRRDGIVHSDGSRLCYSSRFRSPFLFGLFRPVIVLPASYAGQVQTEAEQAAIAHERAHCHRGDHIVTVVLYLLRAVYWFNPVVWVLCSCVRRDMEIACDAAVVRHYTNSQKRSYANALLSAACGGTPAAMACFSKRNFRRRIHTVMSQRQYTRASGVVSVCLISVLTAAALAGMLPARDASLPARYRVSEQIVAQRTEYVGDNSAVGALVSLLPAPDPLYRYSHFFIASDAEPYGLTVTYALDESANYQGAYRDSNLASNALLLFAGIHNLGNVTFALGDTNVSFTRSEFESVYGDLWTADAAALDADLRAMRSADASRLRWGSDAQTVLTRNGEPDARIALADGSEEWQYHALGAGTATAPDGSTTEIAGDSVSIYLRDGVVYRLVRYSGDGEFLWNLGVQMDLSRSELADALGAPSFIEDSTLYYRTNEEGHVFFFTYENGHMTAAGLDTRD